jgi:protoporphyrinogen/coproporphyrinogen III oxidase
LPQQATPNCRIAILGGGVTGLTALYSLVREQSGGAPVDPFLLEAAGRVGGLIRTERVSEFLVEAGPDSFLTEKPEGIALAGELGLQPGLIGSNDDQRRTYILRRDRLLPLPGDWHLFVPRPLTSALTSPLLPVRTRLAVVSEALRSARFRRNDLTDESVAAFVRRHFGTGMLENLAEPLLAGIYGGDAEQLSIRSVLPHLRALERRYGSLTCGSAKANSGPRRPHAVFTTLRDGMEQLVASLAAYVRDGALGRIQVGVRASAIENNDGRAGGGPEAAFRRYLIRSEQGASFEADAVILALPACEGAKLVRVLHPSLARELGAIPYTPAVLVALGYRVQLRTLPPGFGFLVPAAAARRLVACTFVHRKFPFRAPERGALLRCFLGGAREPGVLQMDDQDLVAQVVQELRRTLGVTEAPAFSRVYRWPLAMPQYVVGHEERVVRIRAALETLPGIFLAGNAYSGVGLSDSIRTAKAAAEKALAFSSPKRP